MQTPDEEGRVDAVSTQPREPAPRERESAGDRKAAYTSSPPVSEHPGGEQKQQYRNSPPYQGRASWPAYTHSSRRRSWGQRAPTAWPQPPSSPASPARLSAEQGQGLSAHLAWQERGQWRQMWGPGAKQSRSTQSHPPHLRGASQMALSRHRRRGRQMAVHGLELIAHLAWQEKKRRGQQAQSAHLLHEAREAIADHTSSEG